jgi:hypothetical protein
LKGWEMVAQETVEGKGQVRSHMPDGGQPQVAWGLTQRGVMGFTEVGGLAESPHSCMHGLEIMMRSNIRRDTSRHSRRWLIQAGPCPSLGE